MEPVSRYPKSDQAETFARYIAARLFGNFVIFSPSFDSPYLPLGDAVGRALRQATQVHLITQHPGTPTGAPTNTAAEQYYDQNYLDFSGDQSGHNNGDRELSAAQAINWNLHLYRRTPAKPVINLETMYDGQGKTAWTADDARALAYRSWLSGAPGYTYGAGEIDPKVPGGSGGLYTWTDNPAKYDHWRKAIDWPSARQMQLLRIFFAGIPWWRLVPAHELVDNQPASALRRRLLAKSDQADFAVAYLPDTGPITINLSGFPIAMRGRWFSPVTGQWAPLNDDLPRQQVTLTPPGPGDWVLLLQVIR
jgi:hypothetical protein